MVQCLSTVLPVTRVSLNQVSRLVDMLCPNSEIEKSGKIGALASSLFKAERKTPFNTDDNIQAIGHKNNRHVFNKNTRASIVARAHFYLAFSLLLVRF